MRAFAKERDWGQFHSPKNLAIALSVEVAEIVDIFQWLTQEESRNLNFEKRERDVLLNQIKAGAYERSMSEASAMLRSQPPGPKTLLNSPQQCILITNGSTKLTGELGYPNA